MRALGLRLNIQSRQYAGGDGLSPGGVFSETVTVTAPLKDGERTICIRADLPLDQVPESNDDNNERCIDF